MTTDPVTLNHAQITTKPQKGDNLKSQKVENNEIKMEVGGETFTIAGQNLDSVKVQVKKEEDGSSSLFIDAGNATDVKITSDDKNNNTTSIHYTGSKDSLADGGLQLTGDTFYFANDETGSLRNKMTGDSNGEVIKVNTNKKGETVTKAFTFKDGKLASSHKEKIVRDSAKNHAGETKVVERTYSGVDDKGKPIQTDRKRYFGQYTAKGSNQFQEAEEVKPADATGQTETAQAQLEKFNQLFANIYDKADSELTDEDKTFLETIKTTLQGDDKNATMLLMYNMLNKTNKTELTQEDIKSLTDSLTIQQKLKSSAALQAILDLISKEVQEEELKPEENGSTGEKPLTYTV